MPIKAHIADLEERHRMLEAELATARAHASIDHLQIAELKRRKLLVKDKIAKLRANLDAAKAAARPAPATRPLCLAIVVEAGCPWSAAFPGLGRNCRRFAFSNAMTAEMSLRPSNPQRTRKSTARVIQSWLRTLASGSLAKRLATP
jgi:hypothetical protein